MTKMKMMDGSGKRLWQKSPELNSKKVIIPDSSAFLIQQTVKMATEHAENTCEWRCWK